MSCCVRGGEWRLIGKVHENRTIADAENLIEWGQKIIKDYPLVYIYIFKHVICFIYLIS